MLQHPPLGLVSRLRAAGCVFAEDEAALLIEAARGRIADGESTGDAADAAAALEALVVRRVAGEPLEQVLGWAHFSGLRILMEPGVFVPRRRTEVLAAEATRLARQAARLDHIPVVVDLCCGAGAIAAALADAIMPCEVVAADIDSAAVRAARRNLEPLGAQVVQGDLYDALPADLRGRIDVLAVNAPYVPTDEIAMMPPEARDHEARIALDGGADGLDVHRRVAASARSWLAPRGHLLIETSVRQAPVTAALMAGAGLEPRILRDEEVGGTVVIGTR
jgi:release factor glutamine methyltransferase